MTQERLRDFCGEGPAVIFLGRYDDMKAKLPCRARRFCTARLAWAGDRAQEPLRLAFPDVSALFYSLIGTAKLCGLNPSAYLRQALPAVLSLPGAPLQLKTACDPPRAGGLLIHVG